MIDFVLPNGYVAASDRARARLAHMLEAHGITAGRATIVFTDENGPKGGAAMRCAIAVALPRRSPIRAVRVANGGVRWTDIREILRRLELASPIAGSPGIATSVVPECFGVT